MSLYGLINTILPLKKWANFFNPIRVMCNCKNLNCIGRSAVVVCCRRDAVHSGRSVSTKFSRSSRTFTFFYSFQFCTHWYQWWLGLGLGLGTQVLVNNTDWYRLHTLLSIFSFNVFVLNSLNLKWLRIRKQPHQCVLCSVEVLCFYD